MKIQDPNRIISTSEKKENLRIFLDLDGVICYWLKSAAKTCNVDIEDQKTRDALKNGKRLESFVGGDEKMWHMIDEEGDEWWENIEKLPWADDLIDLLKKHTKELSFLSSPSNSPLCYSGKAKWIIKNYPEMSKDVFLGCKKHRVANPNILLIDDTDKKVKQFRKYGGHAFKWPCPLDIIEGDVDIKSVLKELEDFIKNIT